MSPEELNRAMVNCGCGTDHIRDGAGECDVPALVARVRELEAVQARIQAIPITDGAKSIVELIERARAEEREAILKMADSGEHEDDPFDNAVRDLAAAIRARRPI